MDLVCRHSNFYQLGYYSDVNHNFALLSQTYTETRHSLTGITQNFAGLIVCRLLLGAVEGGLFPGAAIYLTLFYSKRELALRVGYLFVSAALAGACGGLLAYGIGFSK